MKVLVDGEEGLIAVRAGVKLENVLPQIESVLAASRRAVEVLRWNGAEIEADQLQALLEKEKPDSEGVLEVCTVDLADHLIGLLDALVANLDGMEERAVEIADQYLKFDNRASLNLLSEWCGDLDAMLANIQEVRRNFGATGSAGEGFEATLEQIRSLAAQMLEAMEKGRKTVLADLMEFEMPNCLGKLRDIFPVLKTNVTKMLRPVPGEKA